MKNLFSFHRKLIVDKVLLRAGIFLFFLAVANPWECSGEFVLTGDRDWKADIAITFSPDLTAQESEIHQKLQKVLQEQVQTRRVAYNLTRRLEKNAAFTYTITLQGNEGLDQFKRVVFVAADPTIPLTEGPVALELIGKVKTGEAIPLKLESNPSTGYSWEFTNAAPLLAFQQGESLFQAKGNLLGAPLTQTIFLEGLEEGETSLQFNYRRPWAKEDPPKRKITIQVPELALAADLSNPNPPLLRPAVTFSSTPEEASTSGSLPLAASFDWRNLNGQNFVSPVKNQGSCGSCWAFGTVGPMEAQLLIRGEGLADLSEQYLVSCNNSGWSCGGGWWAHDYHINRKIPAEIGPGSVLESVFPYTGSNSLCNAPHSHYQKLVRWNYVGSSGSVPSVEAIKNAIATNGPVAAAVCVGSAFQGYRTGVFETDEKSACNGGVNHAVVLVGWDDTNDTWILKNSWGTGWGESGYMRIKRSTSNIGSGANYVIYNPAPQSTATNWVYLPVVLKGKVSCQQTVCNGDFENGSDGSWKISSTFYQEEGMYTIVNFADYDTPFYNHNGNYSAWLGNDPGEVTTISQRITIPADAVQLGYWYWIYSNDDCNKSYGKVFLGATLLRTFDLCHDKETPDWVNEKIDLSAYRGKTMDLIFEARVDPTEGFFSGLLLDDVSILGTRSPVSLKSPGQTPKTRMPFSPGLRKSALRWSEKGQ